MYKKLDKNGVSDCMGIEVLMLVTMNNIVIWDAILCNMVEIKEFFFKNSLTRDGGRRFL
jgi:hypothetical protein